MKWKFQKLGTCNLEMIETGLRKSHLTNAKEIPTNYIKDFLVLDAGGCYTLFPYSFDYENYTRKA
jgi:hypothetical protein